MNIEFNNGRNNFKQLVTVIIVVLAIIGLALLAIIGIGGGLTGSDISGFPPW